MRKTIGLLFAFALILTTASAFAGDAQTVNGWD